MHHPKVGMWVFDFGDNMAGFAKLSLPKNAFVEGSRIFLKYGEVLKDDGTVNMAFCVPPCNCSSINCANQTDTYIPPRKNASDRFTYTPTFTYHGFRYVQLENVAPAYIQ